MKKISLFTVIMLLLSGLIWISTAADTKPATMSIKTAKTALKTDEVKKVKRKITKVKKEDEVKKIDSKTTTKRDEKVEIKKENIAKKENIVKPTIEVQKITPNKKSEIKKTTRWSNETAKIVTTKWNIKFDKDWNAICTKWEVSVDAYSYTTKDWKKVSVDSYCRKSAN